MSRLAVVIPAYKAEFLDVTLSSFANQTCQDFTVYIGDDGSPHDLYSIVKRYQDRLDIVYRRFDENLGRKNLVAHWNRCVNMVESEEYIWFFSDDDFAREDCVESFLRTVEREPGYDIYHFQTRTVDENGKTTQMPGYRNIDFPPEMSAGTYLKKRLKFEIDSFAVEYIFRKRAFDRLGGFVDFDLAWGSDDATWYLLSKDSGIKSVGARVFWRVSEHNFTPKKDIDTIRRKIKSTIMYMDFVNEQEPSLKSCSINYFAHHLYNAAKVLPFGDSLAALREFSGTVNLNVIKKITLASVALAGRISQIRK